MKIGTINHYTYSNSVTNNQNISHKRGVDTLNKVNPIAHYLDDYFTRMAKFSSTKLEPIIDTLVGKIKPINIKNRKINLLAWDINPNCSNKYVLFLHGMSQNISNYQNLYSEIVKDNNWGILALEYRGYGENKFGKVSEDNLNSDVEKGLNFLINDRKIDVKNIVVVGHSMGGSLATGLASKHKDLKALILLCPVTGAKYIGKKFSENNNIGIGIPPKIIKLTEKFKPLQWLYGLKFNTVNKIKKRIY